MIRLKIRKDIFILFSIMFIISYGCSSPNTFYIDVKKQAIISCKGAGFKKISISNETKEINLEGTEPIIYFNEINNASQTSIYDSIVYDYKLVLQPKSTYEIKAHIGYDRALFTVTFKTDSLGKISSSSKLSCN
jgi:hypothetical protein